MSNPSDIYIQFATRGIDKVLADLKTIEEHATKSAQKSAAVEKALAQTTEGERKKAATKAVSMAKVTNDAMVAAERAGQRQIAAELRRALDKRREALSKLAKDVAADQLKATNDMLAKERVATDQALRAIYDKKARFAKQSNADKKAAAADEARAAKAQASAVENALSHLENKKKKFREEDLAAERAHVSKANRVAKDLNKDLKKDLGGSGKKASGILEHVASQRAAGIGPTIKEKAKVSQALTKGWDDIARIGGGWLAGDMTTQLVSSSVAAGDLAAKIKAADPKKSAKSPLELLSEGTAGVKKAERVVAKIDKIHKKGTNDISKQWAKLGNDIGKAHDFADKKAATAHAKEVRRRADLRDRRIERFVLQPIANGLSNGVSAVAGHVTNIAGRAINTLFNAGGGFSVDQSVVERNEFERQATLLANKAPGGSRPKQAVMDKASALSVKYGVDRAQVVNAWNQLVEKGGASTMADFNEAGADTEFIAKYSKATGTDMGQVANVMGQLKDVAGKGPDGKNVLSPEQMKQFMLDTLEQGRAGNIDIEELLGSVKSYTKSSAFYTGDKQNNMRTLLGMAQVVSGTNQSPQQGATSITNVATDAVKNAGITRDFFKGEKVLDNGRLTMSIDKFVGDVLEKNHGNLEDVMYLGKQRDKKVFSGQSLRTFERTGEIFNNARDAALKAGKSEPEANKAGRKAYDEFVQEKIGKGYSETELNKDYSAVMSTAAEKFEEAVRTLKVEVGDKLVPVLLQLVPLLKDFIPVLSRAIDTLASIVGGEGSDLLNKAPIGQKASDIASKIQTPEELAASQKREEELRKQVDDPSTQLGINYQQGMGNMYAFGTDMLMGGIPKIILDSLSSKPDADSLVGRKRAQEAELNEKVKSLRDSLDELAKANREAAQKIANGGTPSGVRTPVFTRDGVVNPLNRSPAAPGSPGRFEH